MDLKTPNSRRSMRRTGTLLCLSACGLAIALTATDARAATFTVANNNDAGAGSLRQAITDANAAPGADNIDASGINGTIQLTSALPQLSDISLFGPGASGLVVNGAGVLGNFRVFTIPNANVAIRGITISNGVAADGSFGNSGGGIYNGTGRLSLFDVLFRQNAAVGATADTGGGGLFTAGPTTIRDSAFTQCAAVGESGSGGAILASGAAINIVNTGITFNSANRAGGGIETNGAARLTMSGGTLLSNGAVNIQNNAPAITGNPGNGGALHITGAGQALIVRTQINNNTAANEGGGLWNSAAGTLTVDGVGMDANNAAGAAADAGGGAIYSDGGVTTVRNASLTGNMASGAAGSGGAILNNGGSLNFVNGTIVGNTANRAGGGIETVGGRTVLNSVSITGNSASGNGDGAPGNGGGLHMGGLANVFVARGIVSNNTAASEGGGLWNSAGGVLRVDGTQFQGNTAAGADADQGGGAIYGDGGTLSVRNATLIGNRATGTAGSGGGILNNGGRLEFVNSQARDNTANRAGGGIESAGTSNNTLINATLSNNIAGPNGSAAPGNGGGMHISGAGNAFISGGTVSGNTAALEGGGLWNSSGTMIVSTTVISGNTASGAAANRGGGGIFNNGGRLNLRSVELSNNSANGASGSGGALFNNGGTVLANASVFDVNNSSRAGGGIETLGGRLTLTDPTFTGNTTGGANGPGNGGALHVTGGGNVFLARGTVSDNTAAAEGGGLWNSDSGTLVVDGTTISGNASSGVGDPDATMTQDAGGGGIYNDGGAITVRNATLSDNTAAGDSPGEGGGGIFNKGRANISNTTFTGNTATNGLGNGGAILSSGTLVISGGALRDNQAARAGGGVENIGTATLVRTTLDGNTAGINGGGLHTSGAGRAFFIQSTASGNTAQRQGGGLWNSAGGILAVRNSTVDGNSANGQGGGGGIYNDGGSVQLDSATVTDNEATLGGGISSIGGTVQSLNSIIALNDADSGPDIVGAFSSLGSNLIGVTPGNAVARTGDLRGTQANPLDPRLGALAINGGTTQTRLPQSGSPAIDAGNTTQNTDQRGTARPQGARKDIGAVETTGTAARSSAPVSAAMSAPATAPSAGNS